MSYGIVFFMLIRHVDIIFVGHGFMIGERCVDVALEVGKLALDVVRDGGGDGALEFRARELVARLDVAHICACAVRELVKAHLVEAFVLDGTCVWLLLVHVEVEDDVCACVLVADHDCLAAHLLGDAWRAALVAWRLVGVDELVREQVIGDVVAHAAEWPKMLHGDSLRLRPDHVAGIRLKNVFGGHDVRARVGKERHGELALMK